jgi:hypothetical protein
MRRFITPLFAVVLLLGVAALTQANEQDVKKYVCDPITYPDGTTGVAIVRVEISGGAAAAPTVMVTVDYYNADRSQHLGRYEDWSSSSDFPNDEYEAQDYAFKHYHDRW